MLRSDVNLLILMYHMHMEMRRNVALEHLLLFFLKIICNHNTVRAKVINLGDTVLR
jgi:hypothetical protein